MLPSVFKTAWRALRRRPGTTTLNVLGLGVSLGVALLVLLFVRDQWRLDRFHPGADRIHRVITEVRGGTYATAPEPLAEALQNTPPPGLETVAEIRRISNTFLTRNDRSVTTRVLIADNAFWQVFDGFTLDRGSRATALSEPGTAVLSRSTAATMFGSANPVGETVKLKGDRAYTVVGVMAPPPGPTHMAADAILSPRSSRSSAGSTSDPDRWERTYNQFVYTRLAAGASPSILRDAATRLFEEGTPADLHARYAFAVEGLGDVRFGGTRSNDIHPRTQIPNWMYGILGLLALIGVVAAAFNYVNLTVARSLDRAREIGVRKTLGAFQSSLCVQFLGEAVLTALLSGVVAVFLFFLLAPAFNGFFIFNMMEVQAVTPGTLADPMVLALILGVCTVTGLVAGFYPALRLARTNPAAALKGDRGTGAGRSHVRRLLISGQVAFSVILLVSAATFLRQTHHMADADHTLRTERIVAVDLEDVPYETFRRTVDGLPDVEMTAALSHLMLGPSNYSARDILLPNDTEARRTTYYSVDSTFIAQMGLELIARRSGWAESLMAEEGVLFDRNAARAYGFDNPQDLVGTEITFPESSPSSRVVVGVVENFESGGIAEVYSAGMVSASAPRMFLWAPEAVYHALVRSQSGDVAALRDQLETVWQTRLATDHPFSAQLYADVTRMRYGPLQDAAFMTSGVAGLAILIAILGLLSLAAHHVQTRRKEVGVRKALGARLHEVVVELSRDFAVLVVGAAVLATPVAWLLNQWWLQFMTDRVGVSVVVVSACVIALVGLSLLVIGSQTLRAARLNPVHALRDE